MGFLVPLAIAPRFFSFNFDSLPKVLVVYLVAAGLLVAPRLWRNSWERLQATTQGRLFLVFVLAEGLSLIISTIFSSDPQLSLFGTHWRYFGALSQLALLVWAVMAAGSFASQPAALRFALRCCSWGGLLAAVYAVFQFFGVDPLMDPNFYRLILPGQIARPPSSLGHAGYLAGFETVVFFVAFVARTLEPGKRWRLFHFATSAMALIAVLVSGTRAGVIANVVGLAMICVMQGSSSVRVRVVAALLLLVLGAAGLILLTPRARDLRERVRQWTEDPGGTRLPVWKDTLGLIAARAILGNGPETFVVVFPRYQSESLSRRYPDFQHESPHNIFLDTAVSQGLAGLVVLVFGIGLAGWCAWTAPPGTRPAAQLLFAGLIACVVFHQFFVFTLPNAFVFLLLTAALVALAADPNSKAEPLKPAADLTLRGGGALLGLVFLAGTLQVFLTDHGFARIDTLLRHGDLTGAVDAHRAALRTQLLGYAPELWYSQQMNAAARLLPAGDQQKLALSEAYESSRLAAERPGEDRLLAEYNRAVSCALAGDLGEANRMAQDMVTLAPNWYQPHWVLSRLLFQQGKPAEARREGELALALAANSKPALHEQISRYMRLLPVR
jgi:O-antigen ligase